LPSGFVEVIGDYPITRRERWVLSFAIVFDDGTIQLQTSSKNSINLNVDKYNFATLLEKTRINHGNYFSLLWNKNWSKKELNSGDLDIPESISSMVKSVDNNKLYIKLPEPKSILNWHFISSHQENRDKKQLQNICWDLIRGWSWNPKGGVLLNLIAHDNLTARYIILLKGSQELNGNIKELLNINDLKNWWDRRLIEQAQTHNIKKLDSLPNIEELLEIASDYPDQEFQEYIVDISKNKNKINLINQQTSLTFYNKELGNEILYYLSNASNTIDIITPVIDDIVLKSFKDARENNVKIRIITSLKSKNKFKTSGFDGEKNIANSGAILREIAQLGIHCRETEYYPHAKLIVIDGHTTFLSSSNLTANSLGQGKNNSNEAGYKVLSDKVSLMSLSLFDALWKSCRYRQTMRQTSSTKTIDIHEETGLPIEHQIYYQKEYDNKLILGTPDLNSNSILDEMTILITQASTYITISAMSIYDTKDLTQFHQELLNAAKRGVNIKVCVRESNFSKELWPDPSTLELLKSGIKIYVVPHLHSKGIVTDGNNWGIFSGNLNPFSFSPNCKTGHVEIGFFGKRTIDTDSCIEYFNKLSDSGRQII